MNELQAIIFDLGETLFNYGKVDVNHMFTQGAQLSYDYLKLLGQGPALPHFPKYRRTNILAIKLHFLWSNIIRREFDCLALLNKKIHAMGIVLTPEQLDEIAWLWYKPLGETSDIEPDLHDSLNQLQDMKIKLAIISNTFLPADVLDRHLRNHDLLRFFPVRVYSSDTTYRKPHPKIFHAALQQLNVPAPNVAMVGDTYNTDVKGARRLNMIPIYKRGILNRNRQIPHGITQIDHIAELPELIRTHQL